ncbi:MAG: hypothetical protein AAF266_09160 [Planctomycetota bacterium]
MTVTKLIPLSVLALFAAVAVGCQEPQTQEAQKPVIESDTAAEVEEAADKVGEDLSDAASATADAVTPDDNIVDIDTPLGNVTVGSDPATGDTNVDVDTPRAGVDVDTGE